MTTVFKTALAAIAVVALVTAFPVGMLLLAHAKLLTPLALCGFLLLGVYVACNQSHNPRVIVYFASVLTLLAIMGELIP